MFRYIIDRSSCNVLARLILFVCLIFLPALQAITPSATKKGELLLADVNAQWRNNSVSTDLKLDIKSNVCCRTSLTFGKNPFL